MIRRFIERIELRRWRRLMRGHRNLKRKNLLSKINLINQQLTVTHFNNKCYSRIIFGVAFGDAEVVLRQYLLFQFAGVRLSKAILYANGKAGSALIYPMPEEWQKIIEQHGFKVAKFRSSLVWNGYMIFLLMYGILSIGEKTWKNINEIIYPALPKLGRYVFFERLTVKNLPQSGNDGVSNDIITWYQKWSGSVSEIDTITHSVNGASQSVDQDIPLISLPSAILPLTHLRALFRYVIWSLIAIGIAIIDLFRGRWWHALMLNEASKSSLIRIHEPNQLARDYLFHNSDWIYRPLWTYEAEKLGSKVTFYFYSTNIEGFKRSGEIPYRFYYGYQAMNWPHYLVWDQDQADFVVRVHGEHARISIVGPIWFSSSAVEIAILPNRIVSVFDVQPVRDTSYNRFAIDFDYYTPKNVIKFLSDIYQVLDDNSYNLVLKRKREIGKSAHPKYRKYIEELKQLPNFISIDTDTNAGQLINNTVASISMPFTSTALLGRELGKPSIYYDPFGLIKKDDRAAHGIDILCGIDELSFWLSKVLDKNNIVDANSV